MVRMRRNKEQDWTRVLQERLQDAALPLENDIAAFSGVIGQPAARRTVWWPWALAGAAAALAAVLLLRPAPESVKPVPGGESLIAQNDIAVPSEVAETGLGAPVGNDAGGSAGVGGLAPRGQKKRPRSAAEMPPGGQPAASPKQDPEPPAAGVPAEEIPDQVGNDGKVGKDREIANDGRADNDGKIQDDSGPVTSLGELAQAGLPEEPDASGRAARRPRLTLHLQASSGGTSGSGGWGQKPMALAWSENRTEISYQPGHPIYSDVPQHSYGQGIPGINDPGNTGDVCLVEVVNSQTVVHTVAPAPAFPVSFGLSGELALGRRWSLLSGLEYTQRAGYRMNGGIPQALTLHYLGVPLETRFHFLPEQRFRLYLGAGLKAEKCLWTKGGEPLKDPVLVSWNLQAGADFRLVPGVRIYLAPVVSQYLNRSAYANGWDEKPQFSLRAGLSFDL